LADNDIGATITDCTGEQRRPACAAEGRSIRDQ
jgi:hypothetical protein